MKSKKQKYLSIFENCDNFVDLGRHVAYYRRLAGLTQLKLSEKLKVSRSYLGRIEAAGMNQHFSFGCSSTSAGRWMCRRRISLNLCQTAIQSN